MKYKTKKKTINKHNRILCLIVSWKARRWWKKKYHLFSFYFWFILFFVSLLRERWEVRMWWLFGIWSFTSDSIFHFLFLMFSLTPSNFETLLNLYFFFSLSVSLVSIDSCFFFSSLHFGENDIKFIYLMWN